MMFLQRLISAGLATAVLLCGITGCSQKARKERILASAKRDFLAGQYDKAEVEYMSALQIPPLSASAVRQLGIIYFEEGRIAQSFPYLNKAVQLEPANPDVLDKLAAIYAGNRKYAEARQALTKALQARPDDEMAVELLAETAAPLRDVPQMRRTIENFRQAGQDLSAYHLGLAVLDRQAQNVNDALAELQKALTLNPKSSAAYFLLGNIYLEGRDVKRAQQALQSAAELAPVRSAIRVRYAEFQWQIGATNQAQTNLEAITAQAPDYISARLVLMKLTFAQNRFDDCRSMVKTILLRDPANYEASMQNGLLSLAQHDPTNAVAIFIRTQEEHKNIPLISYELALAYEIMGDHVKAVSALNQALYIDPQYFPAILTLAGLDIRGNRPSAAIALLLPLVKQQPQLAKAKFLLADAYLASESPSDALSVYNELAQSFPKNPQIPFLMGLVLEQQAKPSAARDAYNKSLEIAPNYAPSLEKLTDLDVADRHYDSALDRIEKESNQHPTYALPWLLKAKVFMAQRDFIQAEAALHKSIDLNPSLPASYLLLAEVYVKSKHYQRALDDLGALTAKTNNVTAMLEIAEIRDQLKEFDAARDAYEKTLAFSPHAGAALNNLAYLYSEHYGDLEKALAMAEKGREFAPYDPNAADTLGWVLFKKAQYTRALPLLEEAADGQPGSAEIQAHLGAAHYMLGEDAPARVALQRAATIGGDFPGKELVTRRLALLSIDPNTADAASVGKLEQASKDNPNDPIVLTRLAGVRERAGRFEDAAAMYQKVLNESPADLQATLSLAQLFANHLKQPDTALALAKNAHSLAPDDPTASRLLGQLVYQSGDYTWSMNLLEEAARNNPNSPVLLYDLALACYASGDVAQAESRSRRAVELGTPFPKLPDARLFLTMLDAAKTPAQAQAAASQASSILQTNANYIPALIVSAVAQEHQGNHARAQELCEKALAAYPQLTPAIRLCGIVAYERKDYSKSELLLRRSTEKGGSDDEVNYYLGMDYLQLNRLGDSRQALQRSVSLNPTGRFAAEAKLALAKLK